MSGRMARNKGQSGEREVIKLLEPVVQKVLGNDVQLKRNLVQTRGGGHDIVGLEQFAIEVKRCEQLSLGTWWKQTYDQATGERGERGGELVGDVGSGLLIPVLIYRQNRKGWKVRMLPGDFCNLGPGILVLRDLQERQVNNTIEMDIDLFKLWLEKYLGSMWNLSE